VARRPPGRTEREIARLVLRAHGVGDGDIDAGMADRMLIAARVHDEVAGDHPAPAAAADAVEVIGALRDGGADITLLTGNLEPIGRAKVAAAGHGERFGPGGGFGSDAAARADLVGVARSRAAARYRDDEVVIMIMGDTPRDIAVARAAGVRVVAVRTGAFGPDALTGADGVADGLTGALAFIIG